MTNENQSPQSAGELTGEKSLEKLLNALAKALKALTFYPVGHPQRNESVTAACKQIRHFTTESELILLWSRDACSVADTSDLKSKSATAKALTREMLTRKLQRLVILPTVTEKDLLAFLTLIATDAAIIHAHGGIEAEMVRAGITTIGANEVDLSLLTGTLERENDEESAAGESELPEATEEETTDEEPPPEEEETEPPQDIKFSLLGLDILLGMLKAERNEHQYLQLAREIIDTAEGLKRQEAFESLFPALAVLLDEHSSESRPQSQKEYIRYALEQIISGSMVTYLLDRIEENSPEHEAVLNRLCVILGHTLAYPLIQRLCVVESLHARKTVALALARTGAAAIPAILPMLKDERWYVVRNMVTILGEIGSAEAVNALRMTAQHAEPKVRKEVIKAFLKLNTPETEQTLISLMEDGDPDVVRQAIFSLGVSRSRLAVRPLLEIVTSSDPFLKELPLKKHAIMALGRIGDRQATDSLLDLLEIRGWLAPVRWQELKVAAATALGQLGDEAALPLLKRLARRNSPLGNACSDAVDNLERLAK
jgi:HEAT repeat protein